MKQGTRLWILAGFASLFAHAGLGALLVVALPDRDSGKAQETAITVEMAQMDVAGVATPSPARPEAVAAVSARTAEPAPQRPTAPVFETPEPIAAGDARPQNPQPSARQPDPIEAPQTREPATALSARKAQAALAASPASRGQGPSEPQSVTPRPPTQTPTPATATTSVRPLPLAPSSDTPPRPTPARSSPGPAKMATAAPPVAPRAIEPAPPAKAERAPGIATPAAPERMVIAPPLQPDIAGATVSPKSTAPTAAKPWTITGRVGTNGTSSAPSRAAAKAVAPSPALRPASRDEAAPANTTPGTATAATTGAALSSSSAEPAAIPPAPISRVAPIEADPAADAAKSEIAALSPRRSETIAGMTPESLEIPGEDSFESQDDLPRQTVAELVASYDAGNCFAALTQPETALGEVRITALSDEPERLEGLAETLTGNARAADFETIAIDSGAVVEAQCHALQFLRGLSGYPAYRLKLTVDDRRVRNGGTLSGTIEGFSQSDELDLLLVDDEGLVQSLSNFLTRDGSAARFALAVNTAGDEVRSAQLLIALALPKALIHADGRGGEPAGPFFTALADALASQRIESQAAIAHFVDIAR
ncbi:hypothetical protein [Jiella mangrovi]|uniref:Serine/threonine protein kinase n=1 Tax=Jiella mangrovi TaxID=2821407 RepID=A0ABS4BJ08_9HYPH|nr:hypothetical protein [Jiella mangrovi]MBP0616736.1 hypothetical protein [Jiella mangrovi]